MTMMIWRWQWWRWIVVLPTINLAIHHARLPLRHTHTHTHHLHARTRTHAPARTHSLIINREERSFEGSASHLLFTQYNMPKLTPNKLKKSLSGPHKVIVIIITEQVWKHKNTVQMLWYLFLSSACRSYLVHAKCRRRCLFTYCTQFEPHDSFQTYTSSFIRPSTTKPSFLYNNNIDCLMPNKSHI